MKFHEDLGLKNMEGIIPESIQCDSVSECISKEVAIVRHMSIDYLRRKKPLKKNIEEE